MKGASVPRIPMTKDCAAAYSTMRSRGASWTIFVKNVSSPPAFTMPVMTATGISCHVSVAAMKPTGMRIVTTQFTRVRRMEDPRSMTRPQTRYAMIDVAEVTTVIAPMNEFDAWKWSTSRSGYIATFIRLPTPKTVAASSSRR